jgi:undecaprenyl diphosphate synthase
MHIGIIMDGNRRWAKSNHLPSMLGHIKGAKNIERVVDYAQQKGAKIITLYIMSTENFTTRTKEEVKNLTLLISEYAKEMQIKFPKKNIRAVTLGNTESLATSLKKSLKSLAEKTAHCEGLLLQLCINYGGRDEIVRALHKLVHSGIEITEDSISQHLDSPSNPDLIIRTGGNKRLSNFLTWQSAYSELYFTDTLWPDFDPNEFQKALDFFLKEQRNFGK